MNHSHYKIERVKWISSFVAVPKFFHDILGERTQVRDLLAVVVGTGVITYLLATIGLFELLFTKGVTWQSALVFVLIVDIVAGAIANLTQGTNDFYRERPVNRLVFIAIHLQPLLIHILLLPEVKLFSLGSDAQLTIFAYLYTMISSLWVNSYSRQGISPGVVNGGQRVVAGLLTLIGMVALFTIASQTPLVLKIVYALFLFKVTYSFAVDHMPGTSEEGLGGSLEGYSGKKLIGEGSHVISAAFELDPLFIGIAESNWSGKSMAELMIKKAISADEYLFVATSPWGELLGLGSLELRKSGFTSSLQFLKPKFIWTMLTHLIRNKIPKKTFKLLNDYMVLSEGDRPKVNHAYVVFVAVKPSAKGTGIGKALLSEMENMARHKGIEVIALDTENQKNVTYYETLQYKLIGSHTLEKMMVYTLNKKL